MEKLEKVLPIKGLRLPQEIHSLIRAAANASGRTMTQQVRQYIIQGAENEQGIDLAARVEKLEHEVEALKKGL